GIRSAWRTSLAPRALPLPRQSKAQARVQTRKGEVNKARKPRAGDNGQQPELVLVQVRSLESIIPAPENDDVYKAIAWDDPEIVELARSIKEHGVQEPLLISQDGYIISGHRRRVAACIAGLKEVPIRIHEVSRAENHDAFVRLLVEMNSQRIKSPSELL